jgi:DNA-binding response OmpR family regulator
MKTILVIEDQPIMRHKTATILKMEGYDVLEAPDGAEGIRLAHEELPDLILCDIMMPDRDGYEVLQAVRVNRATATTPFIFLTAKGEKRDLRAGMNLGADDYLVKPTPRNELLEAIHARFDRQRLNDEKLRQELARVSFNPDFSSPSRSSRPLVLRNVKPKPCSGSPRASPTRTLPPSSATARRR